MGLGHPEFDLPWVDPPFDSQRRGFDSGVEGFIHAKRAPPRRSLPLQRVGETHEADSTPTFRITKPYDLGSVKAFSLGCHAPPDYMRSGGCRYVTNFTENYMHIDQRLQPPEVLEECSFSLVWFGVHA